MSARASLLARLSARWRKVARDLLAERGRVLLMTSALAVSLFGLGAVLGAYAILTREIRASYLGSRPAAATLEVDRPLPPSLVAEARRQPGIAEAEAGEIVTARVKVGEDWRPLLLFVVDRFDDLRLNVFTRESGAWPPPLGSMLIEALFISVVSWGLAVGISLPLSLWVGRTVGGLSFRVPLPLVVDGWAVGFWFAAAAMTALLAAWLPARRAARLTVREALVQV